MPTCFRGPFFWDTVYRPTLTGWPKNWHNFCTS